MKKTFGPNRRLELTPLEDRTMPAAGVTASISSGMLTVLGTDNTDIIVVRQTGANSVTVDANGQKTAFVGVNLVVVNGKNGNDQVFMDTSATDAAHIAPLRAKLIAGTGNDLLVGGSGDDTIQGGTGSDTIYGNAGDDSITGGTGFNYIYGNAGNDTIRGGNGGNVINGGDGDDYLVGGAGGNWLYGGAGNDTLTGGSGADVLDGQDGNDLVYAGNGGDWLFGSAGNDSLYGGAGNDFLDGGTGKDVFSGGGGFNYYHSDSVDPPTTDKSNLTDVVQGASGTCVILASLDAVVSSGVNLASRIKQSGENQYTVSLYRPGSGWVTQSVYFDGTWTDSDPMIATPDDAWVLIYQRAYLQEMGVRWSDPNYDQWAVKYGDKFEQADSALIALTGSGTWDGSLDSADLTNLKTAVAAKHPVIALTKDNVDLSKYGLISSHAYTVLAVQTTSSGTQVELRNPWGTDGPVTQGANDGVIWVSWNTFRATMQGFTVS